MGAVTIYQETPLGTCNFKKLFTKTFSSGVFYLILLLNAIKG